MTTAVKRACDACHRRKVKCDGINPCRNCASSQLACTYNAIPQKKGPKGSRAKVISELRETQRVTSLSAKVQNRINGINNPQPSPDLAPQQGLLTNELVRDCLDFFFANIYPTLPILQRNQLEQDASYYEKSLDTYCFLTSLCAFTMLQPGMAMPSSGDPYGVECMPGANIVSATLLMEESIRVRKGYDYLDSMTHYTLCTSYFLFACYYGLDLHDKAWYHLREATTLAHMMGLNKEDAYHQPHPSDSACRRRLYWLLFVTERAYAMQRHRPLTLQGTISAPTAVDDVADMPLQLTSFVHLVNLFRPFDDGFPSTWNRIRDDCSTQYIAALQKQLQDALPHHLSSKDAQFAELQINQQWLKNMTWQISVANGSIPSNSHELRYPIDLARDLLPMLAHFPTPQNLGVIGIGLLDKLFAISFALTEYLAMQPASRDPFTLGPREHLHSLLNVLSLLRNGDHRFLPLLLCKVHEILPRLANPMLQNTPDDACSIDIFDGFGNAGMAQPPSLFQSTDEYESKYNVARMDVESPSRGMPASNDVSSPFVSTASSILSPSLDMASLPGPEYNAMSEMVMSPVNTERCSSIATPASAAPHLAHHQRQQHQHQQLHQQQHQQPQHQRQHQHQQPSISAFGAVNHQVHACMSPTGNHPSNMNIDAQSFYDINQQIDISGLNTNRQGSGLSNPLAQGANCNVMSRQQPHRTNSFAAPPSHLRMVTDFHTLQRANSDLDCMDSLSGTSVGAGMDFNTPLR